MGAQRSAIRDSIMADEEFKRQNAGKEDVDMTEMVDPVPEITRKHFEEAFSLARFEEFRKKMDPNAQSKEGVNPTGPVINWPEYQDSQFNNAANDDDLYD